MKSKWGASVQSFNAASLWPTERRRSSRSVLSSNCRSPLSPARNVAPAGAIKAINSVLFYSLLIHFSKEDSPVVTLLLYVARINNGFDCVYWPFDGPTPESNFGFYTLQLFCQVWKQLHSFLSPVSLTVSVWVTQYLQFSLFSGDELFCQQYCKCNELTKYFVSVAELPSRSRSYLLMTPAKFTTIGSSERRRAEKINSRGMENIPSSFRGKRGPWCLT